MATRIVFVVMSATQPVDVLDQLAGLLEPHPVVVHHDFTKLADFRPRARNVILVPDPKETGWGSWGLADAVFHSLRFVRDEIGFDYLQLMSPTCLPIRPIAEFEDFIERSPYDANVDLMQVDGDDDTLMHYAYRSYMPSGSLRFRVLRRIRPWYFGQTTELEQLKSLSRLVCISKRDGRPLPLRGRIALAVTRAAARGWMGQHPFVSGPRAMVGGLFFGARPKVCDYLVGMSGEGLIPGYLKNLQIVDETVFPTLFANSRFRIGPSNHAINDFDVAGSPRWIDDDDFARLSATRRFFARKFPIDLDSPIRRRAIERLEAAVPA